MSEMGIDVVIYVKSQHPELDVGIDSDFKLSALTEDEKEFAPTGATHDITTCRRYYGEHYERGDWPVICGVLLRLFACLDIETIWYFGDCNDASGYPSPFTLKDLEKMNLHYAMHANRPYCRVFEGPEYDYSKEGKRGFNKEAAKAGG
jgi:hypothetical protein